MLITMTKKAVAMTVSNSSGSISVNDGEMVALVAVEYRRKHVRVLVNLLVQKII
jgi:hypothetical protein